jgi:hypothetical protein
MMMMMSLLRAVRSQRLYNTALKVHRVLLPTGTSLRYTGRRKYIFTPLYTKTASRRHKAHTDIIRNIPKGVYPIVPNLTGT